MAETLDRGEAGDKMSGEDPRYREAVEIGPGVRRITCENPSAMTFTGTQTYLVGEGEIAVIDPGPERPAHHAAIMAATAGARVAAILVTHSHRDHSPAARALAAETGAPVIAFGRHGAGMSETMRALAATGEIGGGEGADEGFAPDRVLADGEAVGGAGWRLTALHTPGHLSNHLSFRLEETGDIFTGDTVMGWASTLVSPPEGDMAQFMASLDRLEAAGGGRFLPGHGPAVDEPARLIEAQRAHRRARRDALMAALSSGAATAAELTRRVYTDIDESLWPMAERNVLATLLWQVEAGMVRAVDPVTREARFALA